MDGKKHGIRTILPSALPISLFFVGGTILYAGRGGEASLSSYILAALLSALLLFAVLPAARGIFSPPSVRNAKGFFRRLTLTLLSLLSAAASSALAVTSVREFSSFAGEVMFIRLPTPLISLLFLVFCAFFASKGPTVVKKVSRYGFLLALVGAVLLFVYSIPSMAFDSFTLNIGAPKHREVIKIFLSTFLPLTVPLVFLCADESESKAPSSAPLVGVALGVALVLLCHFNVTILFGETLAETLPRPYPEAVATVTAGKLFLRLEGVFYAMYFAAATFRCAVCIALASSAVGKLFPRIGKLPLCITLAAAVYLFLNFLPLP